MTLYSYSWTHGITVRFHRKENDDKVSALFRFETFYVKRFSTFHNKTKNYTIHKKT